MSKITKIKFLLPVSFLKFFFVNENKPTKENYHLIKKILDIVLIFEIIKSI